MAINKVVYGTDTLIDLTSDTVTADTLQQGTTAHDKAGNAITGTLVTKTVRAGTSEPSNSLGADGDIYIVLEG